MKSAAQKMKPMKKTLLMMGAVLVTAPSLFATPSVRTGETGDENSCFAKMKAPDSTKSLTETGTSAASATMEFGYADQLSSAISNNQVEEGTFCYQAFEFTSSDLELYKGSKITAVNVTVGINELYRRNPITAATLFFTYDLKSEPFYTQDVRFKTEAWLSNECELDTPIEINDNRPFYVGYYFKATKLTQYYMTVDEVPTEANTAMSAIGDGNKVPQTWTNMAPMFGSFCISVTLEGDNLPQNLLAASRVSAPFCTELGKSQRISVRFRNRGASAVKNFKVKLDVTGEEEEVFTIRLRKALANNCGIDTILTTAPTKTEGMKFIRVSVPELNEVENMYKDEYAQDKTVVSSKFYDRALVMEEVTGTWCQWCPSGFVMMDYLKQKYPKNVFRIAIHNDDVMAVESYQSMLPSFFSGLPGAVLNRKIDCPPITDGIIPALDPVIAQLVKGKTYAKVWSQGCNISDDLKTATLHTYAEFVATMEGDFTISAAVVEDGYGPYEQENIYAGGAYGVMGGWEKKANPCETMYDDVARDLSSYPGEALYPATVDKNETYYRPLSLDLSNVKGDRFRVVTMLADATGEIIAAYQEEVMKVGVNAISDPDRPTVKAGEGCIEVDNANNVAIYNLAGMKIADGSVSGIVPGVYVVKADSSVVKVIVR